MENSKEKKQFQGLMSIITTDLLSTIVNERKISEEQAVEKLYESYLYSKLEIEESKLWHFSTPMLYDLFSQEIDNGKIIFPEEG